MAKVLPRKATRESTCFTESRKMYGKRARQESGKLPKDNRVRLSARISEYKDKTELFKVSSKPLLRVGKGKLSETFGTGTIGNKCLPMGC